MHNLYPKGSEWRKWDLQVQTILDDGYIELKSYYEKLKQRESDKWLSYISKVGGENNALLYDSKTYFFNSNVPIRDRSLNYVRNFFSFLEIFRNDLGCIGLTDHNYEHEDLLDFFLSYSEKSFLKILGGVEINVNGIHLLAFFPEPIFRQDTFSKGIKTFLNSIGVVNRKTNGALTVTTDDIKKVINQIKNQAGVVIYPHCNTPNGLFQGRNSTDRTLLAETFNHSSVNLLQTKNLSSCEDIKEFVVSRPTLKSKYCFTLGSDSRSLRDIGSPDSQGNFLWIKADPTFEGFRQILYEPDERVEIRKDNPYEKNSKIFFDQVQASGSKNYVLPNISIPLNRELVTIIGGRGSGKSALLESIAFLNEEHGREDANGKKKIVEYYRLNLGKKEPPPTITLSANLVDRDGNTQEYIKELTDNGNFSLPFLYIGQEQLSSIATNDKELTEKVCELIGLDVTQLENISLLEKAREVLAEITIIREELDDLVKKYSESPNNEDFVDWIISYIKKLEDQRKTLSSKKTKTILDEITDIIDRGLKLQKYKGSIQSLLEEVKNIGINQKIVELNLFKKKLYEADEPKDIPLLNTDNQVKAIEHILKGVKIEIESKRKLYITKKEELAQLGLKEDINILLQSTETVQRKLNSATTDLNNFKEKTKLLKAKVVERKAIFLLVKDHLTKAKGQIDAKFKEFMVSRNTSNQSEKELFDAVVKGVSIAGEVFIDQNPLCSYILEKCVDKRKIKNIDEVKEIITGKGQGDVINEITLNRFVDWVEKNMDNFLRLPVFLESGEDELVRYIFTRWPTFLRVNTVVKLNNVPTQRLSIGQRGTLLLKIYLATASVKQVFVVDQPEDNLDNLFIMDELVPLIRKVKKSRQIIMSTHNANLVVNTDAEQVIVARLDEKGDYLLGSIENPEINLAIKEVLEGGEEAFKQRENRYGLGLC